jgi:hypothetical protein
METRGQLFQLGGQRIYCFYCSSKTALIGGQAATKVGKPPDCIYTAFDTPLTLFIPPAALRSATC